jgi:putative ABC transport system permease protein
MFKHALITSLRNLVRNKLYGLINIIGLALGMTVCLLIALWVTDEMSFDRFHPNIDRLYRVNISARIGTNAFDVADAPAPLAKELQDNFSAVEIATRLHSDGARMMKYEDQQFRENDLLFADPNIFQILHIPLIQGNPETALKEPNSIVLTESTARKYFGDKDPLGKTLSDDLNQLYQVTGIAADYPSNSHFDFELLASLQTLESSYSELWVSNYAYTYILLKENYPPADLEEQFNQLTRQKVAPQLEAYLGVSYDALLESGSYFQFKFIPVKDIHLHSLSEKELKPTGDLKTLQIFTFIAVIILLVSCINFINISTARATKRAREIGIRKVVGSSRAKIIFQFLIDAFLLSILALSLAHILTELCLPLFNNISGKQLVLNLNNHLIWVSVALTLIVVFGAGLYPALLFASFRPLSIIHGQHSSKSKILRNLLVLIQFSASIILIIATAMVYRQLHYIQTKKLGFDQENVVVLRLNENTATKAPALKSELLKHSDISSVSLSEGLPDLRMQGTIFRVPTETGSQVHTLIYKAVDEDFVDTYRLKMKSGRFFDKALTNDSTCIVLNEKAVQTISYTEPLGKQIFIPDDEAGELSLQIIGVVEDFHMQSLHEEIRPLVIILVESADIRFISVRLNPGNPQSAMQYIKKTWQQFVPSQPIDFFFRDEFFNQQYKGELQLREIFGGFAVIAILIASMGLFGLATYTTETRIKEIGIRKVLGASITNIALMLNMQFLKWVVIANLIAWPVAYWYLNRWLQNYAYRTSISGCVLLLSGTVALVIAVLTVSYQSIRAGLSNPVKSLRYE